MVGRGLLLLLVLLPLAGCLDGGSEPVDAADAVEPEAAAVAGNATSPPKPFLWEGRVSSSVHGCTALLCIYSGAAGQEHRLLGVAGGNLTLTWDADNELVLKVEPCQRACTHETSGTSPLTLDIDWLDPAEEHFLVVEHPQNGNLGGLRVAPETPFRVEGTVRAA